MSKYIKPWRPSLFCSAQPTAFTTQMPSDHMNTAQSSVGMPKWGTRSSTCKNMFANWLTPLHWKTPVPSCNKQEFLADVINEQDCRAIRTACCFLKSLRIRIEIRANATEREVFSRQLQLMQASVQHTRERTSTQLTQVARPGLQLNRRPDGSVSMALVLPALTDCRWWFESLLVHLGVSSATRRKATGADQKKKVQDFSWTLRWQTWSLSRGKRSHPCINATQPATMVNRPYRRQLTAAHTVVDRWRSSTLASLHQCCWAGNHR